jgi:hypothetical protein
MCFGVNPSWLIEFDMSIRLLWSSENGVVTFNAALSSHMDVICHFFFHLDVHPPARVSLDIFESCSRRPLLEGDIKKDIVFLSPLLCVLCGCDGGPTIKMGKRKEKRKNKIVPAVLNPAENSQLLGNSSHLVVCWPPTDGAIL